MSNELAVKIFDELYDDDDLNELHKKKIIAQPIGFKLSTIAIIECELDGYHNRLTEENAKLRKMLTQLQIEGGLGIARHRQIDRLLNQLKEQNNDK